MCHISIYVLLSIFPGLLAIKCVFVWKLFLSFLINTCFVLNVYLERMFMIYMYIFLYTVVSFVTCFILHLYSCFIAFVLRFDQVIT